MGKTKTRWASSFLLGVGCLMESFGGEPGVRSGEKPGLLPKRGGS